MPVLLNTSFNNNAEPIVQTVHDAVTCFLTTELDYLVVEDFLIRRRPGPIALGAPALQFRPVTQLAKRVKAPSAGKRDVAYEIYLDHAAGARTQISAETFALLEAADGMRTPESLADAAGRLGDDVRRELFHLWQSRYLVLRPSR